MKNLLTLFLLLPFFAIGQTQDPCYSLNNVYQEIGQANPPITLDLLSGWNMMGFSCVNGGGAEEILSSISDKIVLAKNNDGSVYMPEFGFNGIGNLLPNQGYQIKMSEAVIGFELCSYHINYHQVEGCTDCAATNFNQWANIDDGSCNLLSFNCDLLPQPVVGDLNTGHNMTLLFMDTSSLNSANPYIVVLNSENEIFGSSFNYSHEYHEGSFMTVIWGDDGTTNEIDGFLPNEQVYVFLIDGDSIYTVNTAVADFAEVTYQIDEVLLINSSNLELVCVMEDPGGCLDNNACNYSPEATYPNYSLCEYPEPGYDCLGDLNLYVSKYHQGGRIFWLNETAERGLVASTSNLWVREYHNGSSVYHWGFNWVCNGVNLGINRTAIGTGLQNTIEILNNNCQSQTTNMTLVNAINELNYGDGASFSDWFIPSIDELLEIHLTIGLGDYNSEPYFWSSSEINGSSASSFGVSGSMYNSSKYTFRRVRAIRAFGNWTMGCMDTLACNFNSEANMADGSCEYPELGYDCTGNIVEYVVGMEAEGGMVFYVTALSSFWAGSSLS